MLRTVQHTDPSVDCEQSLSFPSSVARSVTAKYSSYTIIQTEYIAVNKTSITAKYSAYTYIQSENFAVNVTSLITAKFAFVLCTCHRLPPGVGPRASQGNMSGNTKDGLDSLPLVGENSRDFFKFEGRGGGI